MCTQMHINKHTHIHTHTSARSTPIPLPGNRMINGPLMNLANKSRAAATRTAAPSPVLHGSAPKCYLSVEQFPLPPSLPLSFSGARFAMGVRICMRMLEDKCMITRRDGSSGRRQRHRSCARSPPCVACVLAARICIYMQIGDW